MATYPSDIRLSPKSFDIYPNPSSDTILIRKKDASMGDYTVKIYDSNKSLLSQPRSVSPRDSDSSNFIHFPRLFLASLSREMKCSVAVMLGKCQSGNC